MQDEVRQFYVNCNRYQLSTLHKTMRVCLDKDVALAKLLSIFIKNVLRNSKLKRGIRRFRNKKNENKDLSAVAATRGCCTVH